MKRLTLFLLVFAIACATPAPAPVPQPEPMPVAVTETAPPPPPDPEGFRATVPSPTAPRPYRFPNVERITLDNGMRVLVAPTTSAPLVTVRAVVRSGGAHDPADHAGLASFTAQLTDEGAGKRSAIQIAEELGNIGASLFTGADYDASFASLDVLNSQLPKGFEIFADVVRRPTFSKADFEREKKDRLTSLLQQKDQATVIAGNQFARHVYGSAAYGRPLSGTDKTVNQITQKDVRDFYARHWVPNNISLVVTGNVDVATARDLAQRHFGDWKRGKDVPDVNIVAPSVERSQIYLIDRPASVQSEIRVGHVGVPRGTDDYFALLTMNSILGGQFTSRLNLNLRETHGYTYGARSSFAVRRQAGPFTAATAVRNAVTMESVRETMNELRRLGSGDITDEELKFAKDYMMGVFPNTVQTASELAQRVQELEIYNLSEDYFDRYRERIAAVTKEDVVNAAREHVNPDKLVVVVVGKATEVQQPLQTLGLPVTVHSVE